MKNNFLNTIFPKSELNSIINAVKKAELKTSGEIVPMIVESSSSYKQIELKLFLLLSNITLVIAFFIAIAIKFSTRLQFIPFNSTTISIFTLSIFAINIIFLATIRFCPIIKALFISKELKKRTVFNKAQQEFIFQGIKETRDQTGVLIYISIYEKEVVILADEGINNKVHESFWQERINEIIHGIQTKQAPMALSNAITEIGNELTKNFPKKADDKDELTNIIIGNNNNG